MPLSKERTYTIEDIYHLPEGERAELFDGKIYFMAPPSRIHQKILSYLNTRIENYFMEKEGSCEVYPAPFAVFLEAHSNTYVEPDISVICDQNKLDEKGCKGAPDWIVDFEKDRITVHNLVSEDIHEYSFSDTIAVGIYEDFQIDLSRLKI